MNTIGIYIHIPFCEQKCPYCDFYSISDENEYDKYTEYLIGAIRKSSEIHKRTVSTIYFGGGTPSAIGSYRLIAILDEIKKSFCVNNHAEITVEVNPCTSDKIDFSAMRKAGFNRVSIGLQSANDNELKILGRRHSVSDAKNTVDAVKKAKIDNISLDLMLCIPEQTKSSLTESIKFCKDCDVTHISAYILKIEENTHFYKIKDSLHLFDDDCQSQIYIHAVNELEKYGYNQYEISNFSKPGFEGKHNLKYWRDEEYLGFGPSAHSFIDGKRYYYPRDIKEFYNGTIIQDGVGGDVEEYIMLRLRLKEGLDLIELENRYNFTLAKNFLQRANLLKSEQMIDIDNNVLYLTTKGFLVSNSVISYLIDSI